MNIWTKQDNIDVFNDTQRAIKNRKILSDAVVASNAVQQYLIGDEVPSFENRFETDAQIVVSKSTSFGAAVQYGGEIAVLNFASATSPGGGVTRGSFAQEECLCRCSTLYNNLISNDAIQKFYLPHRGGSPLHNDDIIYTPSVIIFKNDDYEDNGTMKKVNIITCAAPNLRETPKYGKSVTISPNELLELHKRRGRKILATAAANKNDFVVLGAFGCGAFSNDPRIVAKAYKQILPEFKNCFKVIEFAIYCREYETSNYDIFKETFDDVLK